MMIPPEKATSRIIHFEILPGLPGVGPSPKHFHQGRPTPWSEGFVVRFWNSDGSHWVGNFQQGNYGYHDVVLWPEANAIVVVAGDFFYLISEANPEEYSTPGPQCLIRGLASMRIGRCSSPQILMQYLPMT